MYRGDKTGIDPRDVTAEVTELFKQSQNGREFQAALEQHGYQLTTGNRGLLILDSAGKEHSLARRIDGVNTKELNAFMRTWTGQRCRVSNRQRRTIRNGR